MYKILLVDDEPLIRKGLLKIIDWKSLDCEIAHAACNGNEAFHILNTQKIDIIISDIKMPGISGIDLAQYVYENYKSTKVILLTGYSDFQFAQSAIKYNVVDFILKPTSTEKIVSSVIKAKDSLLKSIDHDSKIKSLEERMIHSTQKLQVNTLNEIINNIVPTNKIEEKLKEVDINLNNYYLLVSEIKHCDEELLSDTICTNINTIVDILPLIFTDASIYNILQKNNKLCTLINFKNTPKENHSIVALCNEAVAMLKNFRCCNVSIGISALHDEVTNLHLAFAEATKALLYTFYDEDGELVFSHENLRFRDIDSNEMNSYVNTIINLISSNNIEKLIAEINNMFTYFKLNKFNIENIKHICILICSKCTNILLKENISLTDLIENPNIFSDILGSQSITSLNNLILGMIDLSFYTLNNKSNAKNSIVDNAKKYIQNNYNNADLTLNEIANHVHVSNAYLSRLFKEKTGETISELIIKIRIEKAKELLRDNSLKIYEIAYTIGIDDPAYFSQLFKKYTGVSPKEYKYKY